MHDSRAGDVGEDEDDIELSEDLSDEVRKLKAQAIQRDKLISRLERAVFGHEDPKTLLWIPGILQNTADLVKIMVLAKSLLWRIGGTIIVLLFFSLLHSFGLSEVLIKGLITILKGIPSGG